MQAGKQKRVCASLVSDRFQQVLQIASNEMLKVLGVAIVNACESFTEPYQASLVSISDEGVFLQAHHGQAEDLKVLIFEMFATHPWPWKFRPTIEFFSADRLSGCFRSTFS
mmetsp:Transcript_25540/g.84401  ORF Transcript_25540/g.84401 Transcript_25540/m.84401 type:complete len:111 (-) Transcript_25540:28-360(-)